MTDSTFCDITEDLDGKASNVSPSAKWQKLKALQQYCAEYVVH